MQSQWAGVVVGSMLALFVAEAARAQAAAPAAAPPPDTGRTEPRDAPAAPTGATPGGKGEDFPKPAPALSAKPTKKPTPKPKPKPTPLDAEEASSAEESRTARLTWRERWAPLEIAASTGSSPELDWLARPVVLARGPLIVVGSTGTKPGAADLLDGVVVVDGRRGTIVRRIPSRAGDVYGLALDGDYATFTTPVSGWIRKSRLDGLTAWSSQVKGFVPGHVALEDMNGDGEADALVGGHFDCTGEVGAFEQCKQIALVALDGANGRVLWKHGRDAKAQMVLPGAAGPPRVPSPVAWLVTRGTSDDRKSDSFELALFLDADGLQASSDQASVVESPRIALLGDPVEFADAVKSRLVPRRIVNYDSLLPRAKSSEMLGLALVPSNASTSAKGGRVLEGTNAVRSTTLPSITRLTNEFRWDVVLASDGKLHAYSTDISDPVFIPMARGDLRGTGVVPARLETLDSYASRLPLRDQVRWLLPDTEPGRDTSFTRPSPAQPAQTPPLPATLTEAKSLSLVVREGSAVAALADGNVTVCWTSSECKEFPIRPAPHRLALNGDGQRLWALMATGEIYAVSRSQSAWIRQRGTELPNAAAVKSLVAVAGGVVALEPARFSILRPSEDFLSAPVVVNLPVDEVVACERWFANKEGKLIMALGEGLDTWGRVPAQPGLIRSLDCTHIFGSTALDITTAGGTRYLLRIPPAETPFRYTWLVLGALALAVGGAGAFALRKSRVEQGAGRVRRYFWPDTPLHSLAEAAPEQRELVSGLMDFIDNPDTKAPLTLAICGPWGSGKSSVMGALRTELRQTNRHVLVWFNAWRSSRETQITGAFYQAILDQFRLQAGWLIRLKVTFSRVRRAGFEASLSFIVRGALVLGVLAALALLLSEALHRNQSGAAVSSVPFWLGSIAALAGIWHRLVGPIFRVVNLDPTKVLTELKGRLTFAGDLKREFDTVFAGLGQSMKLVVFVDDLDRCPPDRVAEMLEALNLLADTGHCILILGVDPRAIEHSIEVRFKDLVEHMKECGDEDAKDFGARYVEKMITFSVSVPKLEPGALIRSRHLAPEPQRAESVAARARRYGWVALQRLPAIVVGSAILAFLAMSIGAIEPASRSVGGIRRALFDAFEAVARVGEPAPAASAASPAAPAPAAPSVSASDRASSPPPPAPSSAPTLDSARRVAPKPNETTERTYARLRPPDGADFGPSQEVRIAAEPTAPAFQSEWASLALRDTVARAAQVALGVVLAAALLAIWVHWRRMQLLRPETTDSQEFKEALVEAARRLPSNPRGALRFTNLARFMYYLSKHAGGREREFLDLLVTYWVSKRIPASVGDGELERELIRLLNPPARKAEASRQENDERWYDAAYGRFFS